MPIYCSKLLMHSYSAYRFSFHLSVISVCNALWEQLA
jgi:hypothetical protein